MKLLFTLPLLAGLTTVAVAQLPADFESKVDLICKDWNKPDAPGGVVGVAMDGKLVFSKGYGLANLETKTANSADTVMDVGSVSKQFTAMCILLLEEQGKLKTSDEFTKYVPEVPTFGQKITIDHLLHMTSGLRDYLNVWAVEGWNFVDAKTFQDGIDTMSRQTGANDLPGAKWNYCNAGYMMMAVIVERVSGESLSRFAKKNIFEPLGMDRTLFVVDDTTVIANRATSYAPTPGGYVGLYSALGVYGDGGVHTTLADLTKWHENFYDNKLGKKDKGLIEKMVTVGKLANGKDTTYACGLTVDNVNGEPRIQHGGNWLGFNAFTARFPKKHLSIFTLGNDGTNNSNPYNKKIAELILNNAPKPVERKEITVSEDLVKKYVGVYVLPDGRTATATAEGAQLSMQVAGQQRFPLFAESETTFFLKVVDAKFEFVKNSSGEVTGAKLYQNGAIIELKKGEAFVPTDEIRKAYVGHYKSFELNKEVDVLLEGDKLYIVDAGQKRELNLQSADRVTAPGLAFVALRDATGVIRGLTVDTGRAVGMKFIKH